MIRPREFNLFDETYVKTRGEAKQNTVAPLATRAGRIGPFRQPNSVTTSSTTVWVTDAMSPRQKAPVTSAAMPPRQKPLRR